MRILQRLAGLSMLVVFVGCVPNMARQGGLLEGQLAPKIEGYSAGQPMSLKDYSGKVVLLSFWHGG